MHLFTTAVLLAWIAKRTAGLSAAEWRGQSIYQVLTDRFARTDGSTTASCNLHDYCGGTWQGLIDHLDYIQNMGFTAIWISPIVQNVQGLTPDGNSYHGYWAQNINSVNNNFGTSDDLKALVSAVHSRGMYIMQDVVTNHMGYEGCGSCVNYGIYDVFNNKEYFHPFCLITDYNNVTMRETCWEGDNTVSLPDLMTESPTVRNMWNSWITNLVSEYSIDGLRVDSCLEVEPDFFPGFVEAAGVYTMCEAYNGDPTVVCPYQSDVPGLLNYPAYYWITQAFQSTTGSMSNLYNGLNTMRAKCADTTLLGSFLENHDNPRFPSYTSDISLVKNALAFSMLADGIPIIYEGQEQHLSGGKSPNNREPIWTSGYGTSNPLYSHITRLNKIRSWAISQDAGYLTNQQVPIYQDPSTIAVRKGSTGVQVVSVLSNLGASGNSYTLSLSGTGYNAGTKLTELLSCITVTVDNSGNVPVPMSGGQPLIFYPSSALSGSSICASATQSTSITYSKTQPTTLSTSACQTKPTAVAVTFNELVTTEYGQTIKIAGNTTQLGSWSPSKAIPLTASHYTSSNPLWDVTINMSPGQSIQYKFINVGSNGAVTWETGANRVYTVPSGCATAATVNDNWA